jgi:hypothetical protein
MEFGKKVQRTCFAARVRCTWFNSLETQPNELEQRIEGLNELGSAGKG